MGEVNFFLPEDSDTLVPNILVIWLADFSPARLSADDISATPARQPSFILCFVSSYRVSTLILVF
jgi:hypothetical protein